MTVVDELEREIKQELTGVMGPKFQEIFDKAKEKERQQLGNTWDAAINAHDERGHVFARSMCDFDDYFENLKNNEQ